MLLINVATTSVDVGGSASRLAKIARIAELLGQAESDPTLVAIIVAWLSGELPQRQIGVGYAALRSLPRAAAQPGLTVDGVHATLSAIGAVAGKGSQIRRAELVAELFASATEVEQTFLRRLLTGELRQGALIGVMAEAVAKAAQIPAAAVRTSPASCASLTPPALPRPPACTCALTTHSLPPSASAAETASSGLPATRPSGIGTP